MSDRMHPLSAERLLAWIQGEYRRDHSIFGCRDLYRSTNPEPAEFLGRRPESPVGVAAGPHTQLAQNIITAYVSGARIFELKTVQKLDGEDLHVSKPCILAEDEGYNCEWSTELTVPQARDEYIRAWVFLHFLAKEYGLGNADGFLFNMSVGYDLPGIQSDKVNEFMDTLKDASKNEAFRECREVLRSHLSEFSTFTEADLDAIPSSVCSSVTVSTMHGCPPEETERIAMYLLEQKNLNLYLKCNPTLIGYETARKSLEDLGFGYLHFRKESFDSDLSFEQAKGLLERVWKKAEELGLFFGVKMTNTFPVLADHGDLPDEMMYMSGRALLPLSLQAASLIREEFGESLPISYCGGADETNITDLVSAGLFPVTVCTQLLKPGGYGKLAFMSRRVEGGDPSEKKEVSKLSSLAFSLARPANNTRTLRRMPRPENPAVTQACRKVCGACASVCPNRANVILDEDGKKTMVHIDAMCNECGNCASFCPEKKAPYLERLTVFFTPQEFENSANCGFVYRKEEDSFLVRWNGEVSEYHPDAGSGLPEELTAVMNLVRKDYEWLL